VMLVMLVMLVIVVFVVSGPIRHAMTFPSSKGSWSS